VFARLGNLTVEGSAISLDTLTLVVDASHTYVELSGGLSVAGPSLVLVRGRLDLLGGVAMERTSSPTSESSRLLLTATTTSLSGGRLELVDVSVERAAPSVLLFNASNVFVGGGRVTFGLPEQEPAVLLQNSGNGVLSAMANTLSVSGGIVGLGADVSVERNASSAATRQLVLNATSVAVTGNRLFVGSTAMSAGEQAGIGTTLDIEAERVAVSGGRLVLGEPDATPAVSVSRSAADELVLTGPAVMAEAGVVQLGPQTGAAVSVARPSGSDALVLAGTNVTVASGTVDMGEGVALSRPAGGQLRVAADTVTLSGGALDMADGVSLQRASPGVLGVTATEVALSGGWLGLGEGVAVKRSAADEATIEASSKLTVTGRLDVEGNSVTIDGVRRVRHFPVFVHTCPRKCCIAAVPVSSGRINH